MKRFRRNIYLSILLCVFGSSCKTTDGSQLAGDGSVEDKRAREIHKYVVDHLRSVAPGTEGSIWFESSGDFASDWIVQSPENYWGRLGAELPVNLDCAGTIRNAAGDITGTDETCDMQFFRHSCSTDSDCSKYNTSCQDFLPSIKAPGDVSKKMCLGSGDSLLTRFYSAMVSAKVQLDVTSLSYPTGRFFEMTVNALAYLSHQAQVPTIRLLYSGYEPVTINIFKPTSDTMQTLLDNIEKQGGDMKRLRIDLGWLSNAFQPRWNHSKIIVADQTRVLTGGHNPWDPDYLRDRPIFDLSIETSGPLGLGTSRFVDRIWKGALDRTGYSYSNSKPDPLVHAPLPPAPAGKSRVIGMGRMGFNAFQTNKSENAADDGLRYFIDSAKTSLYITQQDFFQGTSVEIGGKIISALSPSWALDNLANAVKRGVQLKLVKSDQPGITGYGIVGVKATYKGLVDAFEKAIKPSDVRDLNGRTVRQYVCDHVEFLPWRFNSSEILWPAVNGKALGIGAHSKLMIVDESAFSVGSQNLYPANLEEFSFVVSDAALTRDLIANYWKPLWDNSEWSKLPCN